MSAAISHSSSSVATPEKWLRSKGILSLASGLLLTASLAGVAFGFRFLSGITLFSPLIIAIAFGIVINNSVGVPVRALPGIAFSLKRVLRLAIILLGFQLTLSQVAVVGASGFAIIVMTLVSTFLFTTLMGRMLRIEPKLTQLIAAGTSICGASAVIGTNAVTDTSDEDVAYAIACVTLFGSIAMFAYPAIGSMLELGPRAFGLWTGASIHEVAQVVAAAFARGQEAGEFGTVAKLSRVMLLAPVILSLGFLKARKQTSAQAADLPKPWFVFGFIAIVILNSLMPMPDWLQHDIATLTTFLLAMALAAMGLATDFAKLRKKGLRPLFLGLTASLFIATFSLVLVRIVA
jgi:uncharacterized integral membrane protein (TIGR00698 family)